MTTPAARRQFRAIRSYALYYGYGEADALSRFGAAVVEPKGQTPDSLRQLRDRSVLAIAYVSVMEIAEHDPFYRSLKDDDFVKRDGRRVRNDAFGTELVRLGSGRWLGLLHYRVGQLMLRDGYDGVFLDTIGNAEWERLGAEQSAAECAAAVAFVRELRKLFPDRIIVQNNGLERIYPQTAPELDAICWENPPLEQPESRAWTKWIADRLQQLQAAHGVRTLLLVERRADGSAGGDKRLELAASMADSRGFLLYAASRDYTSLRAADN